MSEKKQFKETLVKVLGHKLEISFILCFFFTVIMPIIYTRATIGFIPPFWFTPLALGIVSGIIIGSAGKAGLIALLGTMSGRLVAIILVILTVPRELAVLDLFMEVISIYLGMSLPGGATLVIILSVLISGIIACLGGVAGGSGMKLAEEIRLYLQEDKAKEETTESPQIQE